MLSHFIRLLAGRDFRSTTYFFDAIFNLYLFKCWNFEVSNETILDFLVISDGLPWSILLSTKTNKKMVTDRVMGLFTAFSFFVSTTPC